MAPQGHRDYSRHNIAPAARPPSLRTMAVHPSITNSSDAPQSTYLGMGRTFQEGGTAEAAGARSTLPMPAVHNMTRSRFLMLFAKGCRKFILAKRKLTYRVG